MKAEQIYERFVNYEWNEVSDNLKITILNAINEALNPQLKYKEYEEFEEIECGLGKAVFIHYDNEEKTKCTIDIDGNWHHINTMIIY